MSQSEQDEALVVLPEKWSWLQGDIDRLEAQFGAGNVMFGEFDKGNNAGVSIKVGSIRYAVPVVRLFTRRMARPGEMADSLEYWYDAVCKEFCLLHSGA